MYIETVSKSVLIFFILCKSLPWDKYIPYVIWFNQNCLIFAARTTLHILYIFSMCTQIGYPRSMEHLNAKFDFNRMKNAQKSVVYWSGIRAAFLKIVIIISRVFDVSVYVCICVYTRPTFLSRIFIKVHFPLASYKNIYFKAFPFIADNFQTECDCNTCSHSVKAKVKLQQ